VPIFRERTGCGENSARIFFRLSIADFTTFNTTCRLALPSKSVEEGVAVKT
jgi:hypothetical protein